MPPLHVIFTESPEDVVLVNLFFPPPFLLFVFAVSPSDAHRQAFSDIFPLSSLPDDVVLRWENDGKGFSGEETE